MDTDKPIMNILSRTVQQGGWTVQPYRIILKQDFLRGTLQVRVDISPHGGELHTILDDLILHFMNCEHLTLNGVRSIAGIEFLHHLKILSLTCPDPVDLTYLGMMEKLELLKINGLTCEELDLRQLKSHVQVEISCSLRSSRVDVLKLSASKLYVMIKRAEVGLIKVDGETQSTSEEGGASTLTYPSVLVLPKIAIIEAKCPQIMSSLPDTPVVIDKLITAMCGENLKDMESLKARNIKVVQRPIDIPVFSLEGISTEYLRSLTIASGDQPVRGFEFLGTARHLSKVKLDNEDPVLVESFLEWGESRGFVRTKVDDHYSTFERKVEQSPRQETQSSS